MLKFGGEFFNLACCKCPLRAERMIAFDQWDGVVVERRRHGETNDRQDTVASIAGLCGVISTAGILTRKCYLFLNGAGGAKRQSHGRRDNEDIWAPSVKGYILSPQIKAKSKRREPQSVLDASLDFSSFYDLVMGHYVLGLWRPESSAPTPRIDKYVLEHD